MASSLRAIISQHLLPRSQGEEKRVLALEILFNNTPVAQGIRTNKLLSIDNYILSGRDQGMITLDESIRRLLEAGHISQDTAERFASDSSYLS